jgi:hypothetical protein
MAIFANQRSELHAMDIGANYPTPVYVNGYACNNCQQVAEAKKDINPADPKAGPGGVDANAPANSAQSPAFTLGGSLTGSSASTPNAGMTAAASRSASGSGALLNVSI